MKALFALKGITEIKTVATKAGFANVESGMIALGDPLFGLQPDENCNDKGIAKAENEERFITVATGGDGDFDIIVRLIDVSEPLVSDKEMKFIEQSTAPKVIKVESGKVVCGDLWSIRDDAKNPFIRVELPLENGRYKVAFFHKVMGHKFFGYVAVLSRVS
jgi:hypothetical protein